MSIELNTKVVCPVSDDEGVMSHVVGILVDINSRFATVETSDGKRIKVGKTKVEPLLGSGVRTKESKDEHFCPECNQSRYAAEELTEVGVNKYYCKQCLVAFGPVIKPKSRAVRAASGKKSKDNGDAVATILRGKNLDEVYAVASKHLEKSVSDLKRGYRHLNPGQQRMCLGNRLRKVISAP